MKRRTTKAPRFECERCGADAGTHGIHCDPCGAEIIRGLLASPAWVANASQRRGDYPGETMVDTMLRELEAVSS